MSKRYQEREHWSDYSENRKRVCEIYGKDSNKVSCHHIVDRYTALTDPAFADYDINQPSNLYPFQDDEVADQLHTGKRDHEDLHQQLGRKEFERKRGNGELSWKTDDWGKKDKPERGKPSEPKPERQEKPKEKKAKKYRW
jgi:hypothetical protein